MFSRNMSGQTSIRWIKNGMLTLSGLWLACVPLPGGTNDGDTSDPDAGRPRPAWPAPLSSCDGDDECGAGLVCDPLDAATLEAFLNTLPPEQIPPQTPLREGQAVCQPGCRIDGLFVAPADTNADTKGCQSCQPDASTTEWTPVAAGTACDDGLFCTSDSGVPGDLDCCDGAGACSGDPVDCDDGLFCTGTETCNEDTDTCDSAGDPCPGTECNTCQEDLDSCFDPAGSACGDPSDTICDRPDSCDGSGVCQSNYRPSTAVCRPVADMCDVEETCNGRGRCREDGFKPAGVVCNPGSGDLCDPDEVCTGASAACPPDRFESTATVCNAGSGDLCDPDEFCPGVPDQACPKDVFEPSTTSCNVGSGDLCDPDEFCTGNPDVGCPADAFEPATTVCNPGSGDLCDPDELCPGVADQGCPADTFEPATTVCNPGSGDLCDPDELCPGVADHGCPADTFKPATTVCNPGSGDLCDPDELCPGAADQGCPADTFEPATTVCRPAVGGCDVDDYCPGSANTGCTNDAKKPAGFECRATAGVCDEREVCDGINADCPVDGFLPSAWLCRGAGVTLRDDGSVISGEGGCDEPEYCTGVGPDCPEDLVMAAGTVCRPIAGVCDTDAEVCSGTSKGCSLDVDYYPVGGLVCRPATGICDEAEYCDVSHPDCPFDNLKPAGTVCRIQFPPGVPRFAACDVAETCDGTSDTCPGDTRLALGDACELDGGTGTCEESGSPLGFLECVVRGDLLLGSPCTTDQDCQSLHCGETADSGFVCMAENEVGFGEICDGDGYHLAGDPNARKCTDRGGDLNCCRGGNLPDSGETGSCKVCCRDNDLPGGLAIGCGHGGTPACCSGRCTDLDIDESNCGDCGNNCYDKISPCSPSVISCGEQSSSTFTPGVCFMEFPCGAGQVCQDPCEICWFYGNCDTCVPTANCITLVIPGTGTLCQDCDSDSDCDSGQTCFSGCGGGYGDLFCTAPNYCAWRPDDCGG